MIQADARHRRNARRKSFDIDRNGGDPVTYR